MTPFMLERKYAQLKEEILFYEKETRKKGWWFAIKVALLLVILSNGIELLWYVVIDKKA